MEQLEQEDTRKRKVQRGEDTVDLEFMRVEKWQGVQHSHQGRSKTCVTLFNEHISCMLFLVCDFVRRRGCGPKEVLYPSKKPVKFLRTCKTPINSYWSNPSAYKSINSMALEVISQACVCPLLPLCSSLFKVGQRLEVGDMRKNPQGLGG